MFELTLFFYETNKAFLCVSQKKSTSTVCLSPILFFLKRKMSGKGGSEVLVFTWGNYSKPSPPAGLVLSSDETVFACRLRI